jgi:iron complex outermembrane receptor protein
VSGYVQDEWHIVPRKFSVVAGAKLEYNSFSDFEIQPTARFVWTPTKTQTVWGAISRAVRTPTRIDQDLIAPNPSAGGTPILVGNRGFESEELLAYELGYRVQPTETLSADFAFYYHDYDSLRSVEPLGDAIVLRNLAEGETYGGTLALRWRATDWWKLDGNFSLLQVDVHRGPGSRDPNDARSEWNDPDHFFAIRSSMDLPWNLQFDSALRYVGELPHPATPAYVTLDLRLGWSASKNLEVAIVGRNLLDSHHPEFRNAQPALTREVERSVYATVRWTY